MGIRQTLNENPTLTAAATGAIIVIALGFVLLQNCGGDDGGVGPAVDKAFFSTDDGKSYFVDQASNIPPYKVNKPGDPNNGKTAYRVQVFKCGENGKPFVSVMERYDEADRKRIQDLMQQAGGKAPAAAMYMGGANIAVKRPGTGERGWVKLSPQTTAQYMQVMQPKCPDGSTTNLQRVMPE